MFASINQIKRFNKKELCILSDASLLPKDGTKQIIAERIFELKKTYEELCDIVDDETNGSLCCICLKKCHYFHMYTCKTCKEATMCENCISNELYGNYDDNGKPLCPICKVSPMYSNAKKHQLKEKCDCIKQFSETHKISINELCKIITTIKEEQLYEQTIKNIAANFWEEKLGNGTTKDNNNASFRPMMDFKNSIRRLLSAKLKTININVLPGDTIGLI